MTISASTTIVCHSRAMVSGESIRNFSGYIDGENPYSGDDRTTVTAFCGLDVEHYLTSRLDPRITSLSDKVGERSYIGNDRAASTNAALRGIYVLPHLDPESYVPEPEAADLVESVGLGEYASGAIEERCSLEPNAETVLSVAIREADRPFDDLSEVPSSASLDRLHVLEASDRTVQSGLFDLWMYGTDIGGATIWLADEDVTGYAVRGDNPVENEVSLFEDFPGTTTGTDSASVTVSTFASMFHPAVACGLYTRCRTAGLRISLRQNKPPLSSK